MKESLKTLPNGTYEAKGGIDGDGIDISEDYIVRATIKKHEENLEVDLSGTSRQARTCINAGPLDAKTAIVTALKLMFDPHTSITSGTFRNIDIVVPPGSILSAMPPDGAIMLYWEVTHALMLAIMESIGKVTGRNSVGGDYGSVAVHNAYGIHPDGTPWQSVAEAGGEHGPWGASQYNDGENYAFTYQVNGIDPPTETIEQNSPMLLLRKEYGCDTGGAGYNRGGAAVRRDALWLTDATHINVPLQFRRASGFGTYNGQPGAQGAAWLFDSDEIDESCYPGRILPSDDMNYRQSIPIAGVLDKESKALDPNGEYHHFARETTWHTKALAVSRIITNGGGGWGKPFEREVKRVLNDVRNGYISIEKALSDYGVVITGDPESDPEGLKIEESKTNRIRKI
jgi:N-methylhydantoinase B